MAAEKNWNGCRKYVSNLSLYILRLRMHKLRMRIYILRLRMKIDGLLQLFSLAALETFRS